MGSYVNGAYVPVVGEVGWDDEINAYLTAQGKAVINVMEEPYGAVGDGVTVDRPAFEAALADIPDPGTYPEGGGILVVPGGYTYNMGDEPWVISGKTRLKIIATGARFIGGAAARSTIEIEGCIGVHLEGGIIDHNYNSNSGTMTGLYIYGPTVHTRVSDFLVYADATVSPAGYAGYRVGCHPDLVADVGGSTGAFWTTFNNCQVVGLGPRPVVVDALSWDLLTYGFSLESEANSVRISDSMIIGCETGVMQRLQGAPSDPDGYFGYGVYVHGCHFEFIGDALATDPTGHYGAGAYTGGPIVIGCTFEKSNYYFAYRGTDYASIANPPMFIGNQYAGGPYLGQFYNPGGYAINSLDASLIPALGSFIQSNQTDGDFTTNRMKTYQVDFGSTLNDLTISAGTINGAGESIHISTPNTLYFSGGLGFFGGGGLTTRPAVTGSRGGNAALASLLTELANLGLITDSSS